MNAGISRNSRLYLPDNYLITQDESKQECYHESRIQYDEFENEDTGEVVSMDFEVCKDCNAVILNDKIMGYAP